MKKNLTVVIILILFSFPCLSQTNNANSGIKIEEYFVPLVTAPDYDILYCYKNNCDIDDCVNEQRKKFSIKSTNNLKLITEQDLDLKSIIKYKVVNNTIVSYESYNPVLELIGENPNTKMNNIVLKIPNNTWVVSEGRETTTYKTYWGTYENEKCIVREEKVKFINPSAEEQKIEKIITKSYFMKYVGFAYQTTYLNGVQRKSFCIEYINTWGD